MKQTQKDIVLSILKRDGCISRNWCANTKLTLRLASLINILTKVEKYDIETDRKTDKHDTIYRMKPKSFKAYNILYPDGTKKLVTEPVWQ